MLRCILEWSKSFFGPEMSIRGPDDINRVVIKKYFKSGNILKIPGKSSKSRSNMGIWSARYLTSIKIKKKILHF